MKCENIVNHLKEEKNGKKHEIASYNSLILTYTTHCVQC